MPKGKIVLQILTLLVVIGLALYLAHLASGSEAIKDVILSYGYLGIFLIALFSGFNFIVPIPAVSLMPLYIESGLSFLPTVLLITLGMTVADALCFYLARAGKSLISESWGEKLFEKFWSFPEKYYRYPLAILFLFAALAPLPNEVVLIPFAVFLGYSLKDLFPIILAGNLIFNILFAKGLLNIWQSLYY